MPVISPEMSRAFITCVQLPKVPAPVRAREVTDTPPVELKSTEAQTLVVGSGLIVAADKVPAQTRQDLVNCTLFAQLAATAEVGSARKISEWYDAYFRTLTALGWAQSDTQFEEYDFKSQNAEAHKAIIKVLTVLLGPGAAALVVVQTALEALQSMNENAPWITLFDRQSKTGKSARFQVATAELDGSGLLQTALVGFDLKATASMTQVLFFRSSSSSTTLKYAAGKATIFDAALRDQRAAIETRLAAYRSAYVAQIALPPPPRTAARSLSRSSPVATPTPTPARVVRFLLD
jgi:hypothetical protein